jgi:hypothetical protein
MEVRRVVSTIQLDLQQAVGTGLLGAVGHARQQSVPSMPPSMMTWATWMPAVRTARHRLHQAKPAFGG